MATLQDIPSGEALATSRPKINSNFAALNTELGQKETPAGAQSKADAAQAAAISAAEADATSRADAAKAYAVQRANHTGTQAPSTISTDANNRFCTDAEKAVWNGKQAALPNASTIAKITESGGAPLWNGGAWPGGGGGGGTVTTVSIVTANGISGSVASPTLTPAITLTLGAITPASVAATGNVTGANLSGTNTGDQTSVTGNAGTATRLATARTINGVSFDGTENITAPAAAGTLTGTTLASNVTASSLTSAAGGTFGTAAFTASTAYDPAGSAAASTAAHNADAGAHLNIVRRTLSGNLTLTTADQPHQRIIPDADRDVNLPAESTAQWRFLLCHAGASYDLTIKRAGGTTVGVLIPGSVTAVAWDGTGFGTC